MPRDYIAIARDDVEMHHNEGAEYPFEIILYGPDRPVNENVSLEDVRRLRDWLSERISELEGAE